MPPSFRWCLVMSDTRTADELAEYWQLTAAINRRYATSHGYGFFRARLRWNYTSAASPKLASACAHSLHGPRASPWCKIPVMAYVARHGVHGRRCSRLMYLDSDAYIAILSMSVDHFLARGRRMRDEGVAANPEAHVHIAQDRPQAPLSLSSAPASFAPRTIGDGRPWHENVSANPGPNTSLDPFTTVVRTPSPPSTSGRPWHLLFSSNAPFQPDGLCTAVFWVRNSDEACGLLRRWWDSPYPNWSHTHPFEQRPMSVFHRFHRAFGDRVRLMPTATFFRTKQAGWPVNPFVHHMTERFRRQPEALRGLLEQVTLTFCARPRPNRCKYHLSPTPLEPPPHPFPCGYPHSPPSDPSTLLCTI
jgi:hypothetical protein